MVGSMMPSKKQQGGAGGGRGEVREGRERGEREERGEGGEGVEKRKRMGRRRGLTQVRQRWPLGTQSTRN